MFQEGVNRYYSASIPGIDATLTRIDMFRPMLSENAANSLFRK